MSNDGELYHEVHSAEMVAFGGHFHGSAFPMMAAMVGEFDDALKVPSPPRRPYGLPAEPPAAEQPAPLAAERVAEIVAAASRSPAPGPRGRPTPARISVVKQLVSDGRLTTTEGELFVHEGHVTEAAWRLVRQL